MNLYSMPVEAGWARTNWGSSLPLQEEGAVMSARKWMIGQHQSPSNISRPSVSYSRRSEMISQLRDACALLGSLEESGYEPPSQASQDLAENFINELPQAATIRGHMGISDEGEINFVFENGEDCFRAIICDDASLSFYGRVGRDEFFGDDVRLSGFPFMKLVQVV